MSNFILSGFADEISTKLAEQLESLNELDIHYLELRSIDGRTVTDYTVEEMKEIKKEMDAQGIKVSSVGSPIGKISITDDFEPHFEKFKNAVALAHVLETKYIRMFSFYMPEDEDPANYREEVLRRISALVKYAKKEDVILLHENEKGIYGDNAARCADILETINDSHLKAVFDPANFVQCDQPVFPEAYDKLVPYIEYLHIKDADENKEIVPAGYGVGNVEEVLAALKAKGFKGFLSLEPHLGNFEGLAKLERDPKVQHKHYGGVQAFTLAAESLRKILDRI